MFSTVTLISYRFGVAGEGANSWVTRSLSSMVTTDFAVDASAVKLTRSRLSPPGPVVSLSALPEKSPPGSATPAPHPSHSQPARVPSLPAAS